MSHLHCFELTPNGTTYSLSSLPPFKRFHLTSICAQGNNKKKASLYVTIGKEKFLLAIIDKNQFGVHLDLWFHQSQKCHFSVEGEKIVVYGGFIQKKKEISIMDDDEFKAIAFKAEQLGKELEELHNEKNNKRKRKK